MPLTQSRNISMYICSLGICQPGTKWVSHLVAFLYRLLWKLFRYENRKISETFTLMNNKISVLQTDLNTLLKLLLYWQTSSSVVVLFETIISISKVTTTKFPKQILSLKGWKITISSDSTEPRTVPQTLHTAQNVFEQY